MGKTEEKERERKREGGEKRENFEFGRYAYPLLVANTCKLHTARLDLRVMRAPGCVYPVVSLVVMFAGDLP